MVKSFKKKKLKSHATVFFQTTLRHWQLLPSKHESSTRCWTNVGPTSTTLAQHWSNIGWMSRVCWVGPLFNPHYAEIFLYKPWRPEGFSQFVVNIKLCPFHLNTYVIGLRLLPIFNSFSVVINFRRQDLMSLDVRSWYLRSVPALKGFTS